MAKLKKKETWPTFKSKVGSSKTVSSPFCITFGDLINDFFKSKLVIKKYNVFWLFCMSFR